MCTAEKGRAVYIANAGVDDARAGMGIEAVAGVGRGLADRMDAW